jgi:hypothetical protein
MNKIQWQTLQASELAQLLQQAQVQEARAVGAATVYQLSVAGREVLAVALPDGQALRMDPQSWPSVNRRSPARPVRN